MSRKLQGLLASIAIFGLAVILGCASIMDAVTPCYISPASLEYAEAEPTTFLPFTTLWDAKRVDKKMAYVHLINQTTDRLQYGFLKGLSSFHITAAQEFQEVLFSPTGPIGLAFPMLFGGTLGALFIKRPGDKSKKELNNENRE